MMRTRSIFILVLATLGAVVVAAPAMASGEYRSVNSITGSGDGEQSQPRPDDFTSLTAIVGAGSAERSPLSSGDSDPSSLNSVLAAAAPERRPASSDPGSGYRSLNAVVGAGGSPQQAEPAVVEVREGDGFDWFDALAGALIAFSLTLMTLAAARTVARHRRATVESRA